MIPILEVQSFYAIIITSIILIGRIVYCCKIYDREFLKEILLMGILTTFIWFLYTLRKRNKNLMMQFLFLIFIYMVTILLIHCEKI